MRDHKPSAWFRLNAYGVMIAFLMLLAGLELTNPGDSSVARLIGRVSALQPVWTIGFVLAGLCLLFGFARARTMPEIVGLFMLGFFLTVQTGFVVYNVWLDDRAIQPCIVWAGVIGCVVARLSVLLSRDGLTITIPGRARDEGHDR